MDIRLAQQEPADLAGVYFPNEERNCLDLLPPNWVRDLVDGPAFLFLDEINAAVSQLHQAVALTLHVLADHLISNSGRCDVDEDEAQRVHANRFAHSSTRRGKFRLRGWCASPEPPIASSAGEVRAGPRWRGLRRTPSSRP